MAEDPGINLNPRAVWIASAAERIRAIMPASERVLGPRWTFPNTSNGGFDLRAAPLVERKRVLAGLLKEAGDIGPLFLSDHFEDDAETLFDKSCQMGLEGIVSKLRNAHY